MRKYLYLLFLFIATGTQAQRNLDSLYRVLDKEIERFPEYVAVHDREVALLTEELRQAKDDALRYDLNYRLYDKYRPFINDSAIYYLRNCIELAENNPHVSTSAARCWPFAVPIPACTMRPWR